jgi:hypothetical protein
MFGLSRFLPYYCLVQHAVHQVENGFMLLGMPASYNWEVEYWFQ